MKSGIKFSLFSTIITVFVFLLLYIGCMINLQNKSILITLIILYVILIVAALLYSPLHLKVDDNNVVLCSILKKIKLSINDIESIELFQPTMGAIRILGSGGFMGYWGMYREGDIGKYYAFYGKSSDCFLINMKNGDKYVVGCKDPDKMVEYIKSQIKTLK